MGARDFLCRHCKRPVDLYRRYHSDEEGFWHFAGDCPPRHPSPGAGAALRTGGPPNPPPGAAPAHSPPPCPACGRAMTYVASGKNAPRWECARHGAIETERELEAALRDAELEALERE